MRESRVVVEASGFGRFRLSCSHPDDIEIDVSGLPLQQWIDVATWQLYEECRRGMSCPEKRKLTKRELKKAVVLAACEAERYGMALH